MTFSNINIAIYMATFLCQNSRKLTTFNRLQIFQEGSADIRLWRTDRQAGAAMSSAAGIARALGAAGTATPPSIKERGQGAAHTAALSSLFLSGRFWNISLP
jgi:hypothetical protein